MSNMDDEPVYHKMIWAQYMGEDNWAFTKNHLYRIKILAFEKAALVHVYRGGYEANNKSFKTPTKYWKLRPDLG